MPNTTTSVSPMMLVYGRQGRGPLSLLRDVWTNGFDIPVLPQAISSYLEELKLRLSTAASIAEISADKQQAAYAQQYNKRAISKSFKAGDRVIVSFKSDTHSKVLSKWTGPCTIIENVSDNSYLVCLPDNSRRIFHANLLRRFVDKINHAGVVNNHTIKSMLDKQHPDIQLETVGVNLVGVIDDEHTEEFGEIIEMPIVNNEPVVDFVKLIECQCTNLNVKQKEQLCDVLDKHRNVFSEQPGLCNIIEHSIRVTDEKHIPRRKMYPIPMVYREQVDKQINDMLASDIIQSYVLKRRITL